MIRTLIRTLTLGIAVIQLPHTCRAGETCVVCTEPAANYRCALESGEAGTPNEPGVQLLCLKEIAIRSNHKTCSIERTQTAPCTGNVVLLTRPPAGAGSVTALPPAPCDPANPACSSTAASPTPATGAPPVPDGPPATMEALTKQAAAQSKKDWANTQDAIKDSTKAVGQGIEDAGAKAKAAAKQSIDCIASLFTHC